MSDQKQAIRGILIGALVILLGAVAITASSIPTRVSVLEANYENVSQRIGDMDKKLDAIIDRLGR